MQHRVAEDCFFQKVARHFIEDQKDAGLQQPMNQKIEEYAQSKNLEAN